MPLKRFWQTSLGIPLYIEEQRATTYNAHPPIKILGRVKSRGGKFYPEAEGEKLDPELTLDAAKAAVEHVIQNSVFSKSESETESGPNAA